jgi:hypothetical protein
VKINTELLEVLMAVTMKNTVFWKVTPCSLYQVSNEPTACIFGDHVLSSCPYIHLFFCVIYSSNLKMDAVKFLQNTGTFLPDYNVLHDKRWCFSLTKKLICEISMDRKANLTMNADIQEI